MGHSQRAIDQFGTLVTCWDLLTREGTPTSGDDQDMMSRCRKSWRGLYPGELVEIAEREAGWEVFLNTLLSKSVDHYRSGRRFTIGRLVRIAATPPADQADDGIDTALATLADHGLRIIYEWDAEAAATKRWLAIANRHAGLRALFAGEIWGSSSGGAGVWRQALKRVPGAVNSKALKFAGATSRATMIPLDPILEDD